ncbi:MAG: hydrogenase maturation nickel metallochaperone HypA [Planctomycetes bacterium]|nr:hydrogenase maturation nickel metallochaperone HypA [Planctomycetota bacterium]
MHELSIANQLAKVAEKAAVEASAVRVTAVTLRLGVLSGVVREALEFAWEFVSDGTLLAGAALRIEEVKVRGLCHACSLETEFEDPRRLRCPSCDAPVPDLLAGRELIIRSIDYDTADEAGDGFVAGHDSSSATSDPASRAQSSPA